MSDFINTHNTDHRELMSHSDKTKKTCKITSQIMDNNFKYKFLEICRMLSPVDMHTMELSRSFYLVTEL